MFLASQKLFSLKTLKTVYQNETLNFRFILHRLVNTNDTPDKGILE